ncbi:hydratase [Lithospermum erythrorhizon]|uniref:Delta(3)-Delta(2)-enoyl-CoA isomerase n=1 Tax=Lithospermum erythrorhizon TaxID=34254 RepID=A0AAV3NVK5_LITER
MSTLEKRGNIFILTITGTDDHRLNPTLLNSLTKNLAKLRAESTPHSVLITTSQGKFFSNGYDLKWAGSTPDNLLPARDSTRKTRLILMDSKLRSVVHHILTLPMPTIAAVTGHASAGGMALVLCHDYVIMRRDRGFLYMSEMDIGMIIPSWFVSLIKSKVGSPKGWREVVMVAAKVTAERGVELGIVDKAVDGAAETVEAAVEMAEKLITRKWDGHVYADNRKVVFAEVLRSLDNKVNSRL